MGREEGGMHLLSPHFSLHRFSLYLSSPSSSPVLYGEIADINVDGKGDTAKFAIDEKGVVLDKEYMTTYKVRVGRGVPSGELIKMPAGFEGPLGMELELDFVEVLIK